MLSCWNSESDLKKAVAVLVALVSMLSSCAQRMDKGAHMIVSVKDQKMLLVHDGMPVKTYKISTSKFGLGSDYGSMRTPVGKLRVAKKIGHGAPIGAVFKSRKPTGEILKPNAPGRDPITTRILWLEGLEKDNANSFKRMIYIHGTPEESKLGKAASYGCVRMASCDVVELFDQVGPGAQVHIVAGRLPKVVPAVNSKSDTSLSRAMVSKNTSKSLALKAKPIQVMPLKSDGEDQKNTVKTTINRVKGLRS